MEMDVMKLDMGLMMRLTVKMIGMLLSFLGDAVFVIA